METADVLQKKFGWSHERIAAALLTVLMTAKMKKPGQKLHVVSDEPDNRILECALAAKADLLVTGDKQLLALDRYEETRIVTLRAFLEML